MSSFSEIAKFFPISEQEKEDILHEFGKSKQDIEEDVQIIKMWLEKQPHIPKITDDSFITKVLIRNKCRIEKTKLKIDSYFTSKTVYADFYASLDPCSKEIVASTKYTFNTFMPKLTPRNSRVNYWTMRLSKDERFDSTAQIRFSTLLTEMQFLFDDCPKVVTIFDATGYGMTHALKMDLNVQSKMFKLFFEAFSGRVEAVHTVNVSAGAEKIMNLFKPMFPVKMRQRMFFHSNFETLHKIIPKECLPSELGGDGPSAIELSSQMAEAFQKNRDNILAINKIGTNEKLRIGEPPIATDMFGTDGTFKKIAVD